jgi:hypothetical protein
MELQYFTRVRQGDLLSPLLFVLVMEALSRMVNATKSKVYCRVSLWEKGSFQIWWFLIRYLLMTP